MVGVAPLNANIVLLKYFLGFVAGARDPSRDQVEEKINPPPNLSFRT